MADAVVLGVGHSQIGVPHRFRRRIVAIEVGTLRSAFHDDGIDACVGCPVKGVSVQVADSDCQRALGVRTVGQVKAVKLELGPGLIWTLEIGARFALVAGTCE